MMDFSAAKMNGAQDQKFQTQYNYLLDLLSTYMSRGLLESMNQRTRIDMLNGRVRIFHDADNYLIYDGSEFNFGGAFNITGTSTITGSLAVNATVGGKAIVISINPTEGIKITSNDDTVAEVTSDGYFASSRVYDPASPNNYITLEPDTTYETAVRFVRTMSGSPFAYFTAKGSLTVTIAETESSNMWLQTSGSNARLVLSGTSAFCSASGGAMAIGVNATGPYYVKSGVVTYF